MSAARLTIPTRTVTAPPVAHELCLASGSPRRQRMLRACGLDPVIEPAGVDDGCLVPGRVAPAQWVTALAYFKAQWVAERRTAGVVLGADTVCVHDGAIFGQPVDAAHAARMLRAMRERRHVTMTGVTVVDAATGARWFLTDATAVTWGAVSDDAIDAYVASEQWRGKAGAYNLEERVADGWPITVDGDPDTVMGLPMQRLAPWFDALRAARERGGAA